MTESQLKMINDKVYSIKKANWDIEVPKHKIAGKEWLKSQFLEHLYQTTFQILKNIFGLIVMPI